MDPLRPELSHPILSTIDAIFISKIEEVNWLLNIRALYGPYENDPLFNGFILATRERGRHPVYHIHVFTDNEHTKEKVKETLAR